MGFGYGVTMATRAIPRPIPVVDTSLHPDIQRAVTQAFQNIYDLRDAIVTLKNQQEASQAQAAAQIQKSALKTESLITTVQGFNLILTGSSSPIRTGQVSVLPMSIGSVFYDNATAGTIKWYFTGLKILWPDGTSTVVPDTTLANPSISVSGLTAGNTYSFYPFYDVSQLNVQWVQTSGGVGTPPAAYLGGSTLAGQQQNSDGNVAISVGAITAAATAGGGGGGSGGGRVGYFNGPR